MTRRDTGALYQTWNESWRPRTNHRQVVLTWGLTVLVLAAVPIHWLMVVSPEMAVDFARLERPYQPWYLSEHPLPAVKELASAPAMKATTDVSPRLAAPSREFLASRPNLVPLSEDWDAGELQRAILEYLDQKSQDRGNNPYTPSTEASSVAQDLAERYAVGGPEALQGEYENALLAGGWLWEVRRGCEAGIYLSFPGKSIEQMGCFPETVPLGQTMGVGLARWRGSAGESAPVLALVWHTKGGEGGRK